MGPHFVPSWGPLIVHSLCRARYLELGEKPLSNTRPIIYWYLWLYRLQSITHWLRRALAWRSDQPALARQFGRLRAVGGVQLHQDVRDVVLHGPLRQRQPVANLAVALALRQQPQHLDLALAQLALTATIPVSVGPALASHFLSRIMWAQRTASPKLHQQFRGHSRRDE